MIVVFKYLTAAERSEFIEGFKHFDVIGVNDWDTSTPWGCPWLWAVSMEASSNRPFNWGKEWFVQNFNRILAWHFSKEDTKSALRLAET